MSRPLRVAIAGDDPRARDYLLALLARLGHTAKAASSGPELVGRLSESEDYSGVQCPECHGRLVVHQPDERLPERLLGVCRSCFTWFLIDAATRTMLRLPGQDAPGNAGRVSTADRLGRSTDRTSGTHRLDRSEVVPKKRRAGRGTSSRTER